MSAGLDAPLLLESALKEIQHVVSSGDPNRVSQNIAEALITTAAGLVVGILALITYHYFRAKIESIALEMESFIIELFNARIPHWDNSRS